MATHSEAVEHRFRDPRWSAPAAVAPQSVNGRLATGRARTPASAAVLELTLVVDGGIIRRAMFRAHGCPSCIAAADWACEWMSGRATAEARELTAAQIEAALALAAAKRHCGLLVVDALQDALDGSDNHGGERSADAAVRRD